MIAKKVEQSCSTSAAATRRTGEVVGAIALGV
jgi:hypothetical protein